MSDVTWTLTVDGVAHVVDEATATRVLNGVTGSPAVGRFDVRLPASEDVVWIDLANPDTWRLTRNDVGTLSDELPQFQGKDISYESVRHGAKIKVVIRCDSPEAWSVLWQEPGDTTWARAGELLTHAGGYVAESRTDRLKGRNWRELADLLIAG